MGEDSPAGLLGLAYGDEDDEIEPPLHRGCVQQQAASSQGPQHVHSPEHPDSPPHLPHLSPAHKPQIPQQKKQSTAAEVSIEPADGARRQSFDHRSRSHSMDKDRAQNKEMDHNPGSSLAMAGPREPWTQHGQGNAEGARVADAGYRPRVISHRSRSPVGRGACRDRSQTRHGRESAREFDPDALYGPRPTARALPPEWQDPRAARDSNQRGPGAEQDGQGREQGGPEGQEREPGNQGEERRSTRGDTHQSPSDPQHRSDSRDGRGRGGPSSSAPYSGQGRGREEGRDRDRGQSDRDGGRRNNLPGPPASGSQTHGRNDERGPSGLQNGTGRGWQNGQGGRGRSDNDRRWPDDRNRGGQGRGRPNDRDCRGPPGHGGWGNSDGGGRGRGGRGNGPSSQNFKRSRSRERSRERRRSRSHSPGRDNALPRRTGFSAQEGIRQQGPSAAPVSMTPANPEDAAEVVRRMMGLPGTLGLPGSGVLQPGLAPAGPASGLTPAQKRALLWGNKKVEASLVKLSAAVNPGVPPAGEQSKPVEGVLDKAVIGEGHVQSTEGEKEVGQAQGGDQGVGATGSALPFCPDRQAVASAVYGRNRWDAAEFKTGEDRQKFLRMLGIHGAGGAGGGLSEPAQAPGSDVTSTAMRGQEQQKVLAEMEQAFVRGVAQGVAGSRPGLGGG